MYSHLAKGFAEANEAALEEVNRRRLNSCSQHFFDCQPIDWKKKTKPETLRCVMCGGIMSFEAATAYATAYAHMEHEIKPDEVLPGFSR